MTIKAIIVMLVCVIPIWGGLIGCIVKLQKMKRSGDED
ncbi:MetS family NSS transporter small subunit [Bacilliculturomica massiliensis]|nr:MetS family NSS transporter small subunit [Bacilliculturomica massiliensis]